MRSPWFRYGAGCLVAGWVLAGVLEWSGASVWVAALVFLAGLLSAAAAHDAIARRARR